MTPDADARELNEDLAFFGRVTASATHQINNVFSILAELHGLIEDMVAPEVANRPLSPEKLADVTARCQRQVERGVHYVDKLNAFAHSVDEPTAELELGEALTGVEGLTARLVQLRRAKLETRIPAVSCTFETRPFRFLRAVYRAVELALEDAEQKPRTIVLTGRIREPALTVVVEADGPLASDADAGELVAELERLVGDLGGQVATASTATAGRVELELPLRARSGGARD
jgi:hypothetical protein